MRGTRALRWLTLVVVMIPILIGIAALVIWFREGDVSARATLSVPPEGLLMGNPPQVDLSSPENAILSYFAYVDYRNSISDRAKSAACKSIDGTVSGQVIRVEPLERDFTNSFLSGQILSVRLRNLRQDLKEEIGPLFWACPQDVREQFERRIERLESVAADEVVAYVRVLNVTQLTGLKEALTAEETSNRQAGMRLRFRLKRLADGWKFAKREAWDKNWESGNYEWIELWKDKTRAEKRGENHYPYTGVPPAAYE